MKRELRPYVAIAVIAVLADVVMVALDMGPSTPLVVAGAALLAAVVWSRRSLVGSMAPLRKRSTVVRAADRPGTDQQVRAVRTGLLFGQTTDGHADRVCRLLVELIDDQLRHEHGVAIDTPEAEALLGDELTTFVDETTAGRPTSDPVRLERVVTLVERL